jgi:hypothetical protein
VRRSAYLLARSAPRTDGDAMIRIAALSATLLLPLALGCADPFTVVTPTTPQTTTGAWTGHTVLGRLEMVLAEEAGGRISGGGFIRAGFRTIAFEVAGANAFPDVALSLRFGGGAVFDPQIGTELVSYRAEFDASRAALSLFGRLQGGHFRDMVLRVERN